MVKHYHAQVFLYPLLWGCKFTSYIRTLIILWIKTSPKLGVKVSIGGYSSINWVKLMHVMSSLRTICSNYNKNDLRYLGFLLKWSQMFYAMSRWNHAPFLLLFFSEEQDQHQTAGIRFNTFKSEVMVFSRKKMDRLLKVQSESLSEAESHKLLVNLLHSECRKEEIDKLERHLQ